MIDEYVKFHTDGFMLLCTKNANEIFDSRCPGHRNEPEGHKCLLRERNSKSHKYKKCQRISWNKPTYYKLKEMDCKAPGGSVRFYITTKGFLMQGNDYISPDSYLKHKNQCLEFAWAVTSDQKHDIAGGCDKTWWRLFQESWIHSYIQDTSMERTTVIETMVKAQLPSKNTMLECLRSHQCFIYPYYNQCSKFVLIRRTPLTIGFDHTFSHSNTILDQSLQAQGTTLTITDDMDISLGRHFINGKGESHEQDLPYLVEIRLLCLLLGDEVILNNNPTKWLSDKHCANKHLPQYIDDQVLAYIKQNQHNPLYQKLIEKLQNVDNPFVIEKLQKLHAECLFHDYNRVYSNLKEDGITATSHGDYSLCTGDAVKLYASIQKGDAFLSESQSMLLSAKDFYKQYKNEIHLMSDDIIRITNEIRIINGENNVNTKNIMLNQLKHSQGYTEVCDFYFKVGLEMQEFGHHQFNGLFKYNDTENKMDTEWINNIQIFQDENNNNIEYMTHSLTLKVSDIIMRHFGYYKTANYYDIMLKPYDKFVSLKMKIFEKTYSSKIRDRKDSNKPIMQYTNISKYVSCQMLSPEHIKAAIDGRNEYFTGKFGNVGNEQEHIKMGKKSKINARGNTLSIWCLNNEMDELHNNDKKIENMLATGLHPYSKEFIKEWREIISCATKATCYDKYKKNKQIFDITGYWDDWDNKCHEMKTERDLIFKHRKLCKKRDEILIFNELDVLKPNEISIDFLCHLTSRYNFGLYSIIKLLQNCSLTTSHEFQLLLEEQDADIISKSIPKIYQKISEQQFGKIQYFNTNNNESDQDIDMLANEVQQKLPSLVHIPYTQNTKQTTVNNTLLIEKLLQDVNREINNNKDIIPLSHAHYISTNHTFDDFVKSFDQYQDAEFLFKKLFNKKQIVSIGKHIKLHQVKPNQFVEKVNYSSFTPMVLKPDMLIMTAHNNTRPPKPIKHTKKKQKKNKQQNKSHSNMKSRKSSTIYKKRYILDSDKSQFYDILACECDLNSITNIPNYRMGGYLNINKIREACSDLTLSKIDAAKSGHLTAWCYLHGCNFKYKRSTIITSVYKKDWLFEHFNTNKNDISNCYKKEIDPYSQMKDKIDYNKIVETHSNEKFWVNLRNAKPQLFTVRTQIVIRRIGNCIEKKLHADFEWDKVEGNEANSLPNCYDTHINVAILDGGVEKARKKIVEYTINNCEDFTELGDENALRKYYNKNIHLTPAHVYAMHCVIQQNMVIYLYDEQNDALISWFLYNSDWCYNEACALVHTKFYGTDRFQLIELNDNDLKYTGNMYVPAENNGMSQCLLEFDRKYNMNHSVETEQKTISLPSVPSLSNVSNTNEQSQNTLTEQSYFGSTLRKNHRIYHNLSSVPSFHNMNKNGNGEHHKNHNKNHNTNIDTLNQFIFTNDNSNSISNSGMRTRSGKRFDRDSYGDELRQIKLPKRLRK
eukprot:391060_1